MPLGWKPASTPLPTVLRGRYVTLEPFALRHADALWEAIDGHDELWTWLASGPYASISEIVVSLERWRAAEKALLFAIIPAETQPAVPRMDGSTLPGCQAAGWASFMRIKPQHGVIEVGNVLFSPALQRSRAATEAMYLMARHVFETLGYRRYEWKCNAENEPSRRAAQRLGFTFEGIFRQHMVVRDRNRDTAWFSMLGHEWPARKHVFETWLDPMNFDQQGRQKHSLSEIREGCA